MPGFCICITQGSENAQILLFWENCPNYAKVVECLVKVSESFKYTASSKYARDQNMAGFWISEDYTGCWICLNKPKYALIMSQ